MAEYKLTYFNVRGLAEPARLLFALAKVPYEDVRIPYTYGEKNEIPAEIKQKLTYGQVPLLEFGDQKLTQSGTINRFLARQFNLLGANDMEAARIDEIIDANKDFADSLRPLWAAITAKDEDEKAAAKKTIEEIAIPKYMGKFSQILQENGTGFLVGKSVSLADVIIFNMISNMVAMAQVDVTKSYEPLAIFKDKIGNIPQIKEWVDKRPQTLF